jgi:hypothetical protein
MTLRSAIICTGLALAGCSEHKPQSDLPARESEYYAANPDEIEPMQKICREWAGSTLPADTQPAVVKTNCRAAAFAKSQLQIINSTKMRKD